MENTRLQVFRRVLVITSSSFEINCAAVRASISMLARRARRRMLHERRPPTSLPRLRQRSVGSMRQTLYVDTATARRPPAEKPGNVALRRHLARAGGVHRVRGVFRRFIRHSHGSIAADAGALSTRVRVSTLARPSVNCVRLFMYM